MSLLQPLMLALLAAALIPIFVHLFNRRRAVKRPFPAIEFLLRSNQKLARSLKIRQWLLLLLRVAVFLLIPLALAKPYLLSDKGASPNDRLPAAVVFILDDSFSMSAPSLADGGASHFDLAHRRLADLIQALPRHDRAAVVLASRPEHLLLPDLVSPPSALADVVAPLARAHDPGDLQRALEVARDLLIPAEQPVRKVVILTDLTRSGWPDTLSADVLSGVARVEVIDISDGRALPNAAITAVGAGPDPSGEPNTYLLWADVLLDAAAGTPPLSALLTFTLDGSPCSPPAMDLSPGVSTRFSCSHHLPPNAPGRATITLTAADAIPADNTASLRLSPQSQINALLINGDPNPLPLQDELFFLERALKPAADSASLIIPRVITPDGLTPDALAASQVVILANVSTLSDAQAASLRAFVERGGGLLIAAGDHITSEAYNRLLPTLLPRPLHDPKRLADLDDPDAPLKVTRLGAADYSHPILQPFSLPGGEGLQKIMVYQYMMVRPDQRSPSRTLLRFADDSPALMEHAVGEGRVLLWTTSLDRDWNDLPLNKAYLPLMRRSIEYLAFHHAAPSSSRVALVGTPFAFPITPDVARLELTHPSGQRIALSLQELQAVNFTPSLDLTQPGFYDVATATSPNGALRPRPDLLLPVNLDPKGSRAQPVTVADLSVLWSAPPDPTQSQGLDAYQSDERRVDLWPILLLVALMLLYLESLIGFRRSFWKREPKPASP